VPDWLVRPLLDWLERTLNERTVQLVAARMRISLLTSVDPPRTLCAELEHRARLRFDDSEWDVLDAIDYLVQVDWYELKLPDIIVSGEPRPARSWCAWTKSPRSRRWIAPPRPCRCGQGLRSGAPTTTCAMG
jgi:hypothetical protein